MEKKTAPKEEALSPYQQSIQKFTEQIMDVPIAGCFEPGPKEKLQSPEPSEKNPPEAKEEIKQPSADTTHGAASPDPPRSVLANSCFDIKTGTEQPLMKVPPIHIKGKEEYEPLFSPEEKILEESLRKEAERVSHQENVMNRVVYDCVDASPYNPVSPSHQRTQEYTMGQGVDGELKPYYIPTGEDDVTLVFESRFESGNLRRAIQVYEYEYDLILRPDYFTKGNTQWFYFRVSNTRPGKLYRFNIINLLKPDSLYNHGMRPLIYSEAEAKTNGKGWHRGCHKICYFQNTLKRKTAGFYCTLTFSITFSHKNDTVYFAHGYPYTYTDLCRYLTELENDPRKRDRVRRRTLCQTNAHNNCDVLIVTQFTNDPEAAKNRKGIVITGRVHPGESGASYMIKGVIDFLTGPTLTAKILRDNFVFKIVPMLNPDGVINGNSRCSLAGVDLNRCWIDPSKQLHPTISNTKMVGHSLNREQMIKKFQEDREVFLYCDFHGHSRKKNVFMYGCSNSKGGDILKEKIFPNLLSKNCDIFSFPDTCFAIQKSKESTGRVVAWRELNIVNSYTLEASFCGADFGKFADYHFNMEMLEEVGHQFCQSIFDFCDPDQVKIKKTMEELELLYPTKEPDGEDGGRQ